MDHTIEVEDLAVTYRSFGSKPVTALRGVSLHARAGDIVGVLGPKGSGKSSLLSVLAGSLTPSRGRVCVLGAASDSARMLATVGYQPEGPRPFPWCTPLAFVQRIAALLGEPFRDSRPRLEISATLPVVMGLTPESTARYVAGQSLAIQHAIHEGLSWQPQR